ncbi:Uncharacterised protein [Helicobacter mustelae]|uniref:XRE family transcriptional regulator n=2 Tax=Helicobacter mustelae TaxID=217 RepID=D3UH33_HELM1|nr:Putative hypothetical protein [Helicobacter mustelae 12198]SQH71313.1 Uncharacterised protein [Helicobacter mustelae]STP12439.1 Uncharacterised protein [Helicobacter mustelae]
MDYTEFSEKLKQLRITKGEFARMVDMNYHSIANWKSKGVPYWACVLLHHYEKSKKLDLLLDIIKQYDK